MKKRFRVIVLAVLAAVVTGGCGETQSFEIGQQESVRTEEMSYLPGTMGTGTADGGPVAEEESGREHGEQEAGQEQGTDKAKGDPESGITEDIAEIRLVMVGDVLMHTPVLRSGRQEDGTLQYDHLFAEMKERISEADIAIVNQEVILGGEALGLSGYPAFNAPFEVGDALVEAGFDVVLHATNHALDKGRKGVENSLAFWEETYPEIGVLGIQDSAEEQDEIYYYEKNGITLAILNYTYSTNGIPMPDGMPYMVNMLDREQIAEDVKAAEEKADFVIVCPHWGTEYMHTASSAQRKWAEFFLECGVDLVIGTHPHVIQPVENFVREDGHEMLVYYSLGNYVNATAGEGDGVADRMLGALASVTIAREKDGRVVISQYGAEPLVTYVSADESVITTYPMEEFTEEMAGTSITVKKDPDFGLGYCREIWEEVYGD